MDNLVLLANTPAQAEKLLQKAGGIGLYVNTNKIEFMYFKQEGTISIEINVNIWLTKALNSIDRFMVHMEIWSIR